MGGVILVFSVMLALVVWWHRRRVRNIRFQLDEHARRIAENQTEIERLQQNGEASEQTIAELNRQIETSRERISNKLLIGTRAFVKLQQKESVADSRHEIRGTSLLNRLLCPVASQALAGVGAYLCFPHTSTIHLPHSSG